MGLWKKRLIRLSTRTLVEVGRRVSPKVALRVAGTLGRRYKLDPQLNKRQLRQNIEMFFPDADRAWVEETARDVQVNSAVAKIFDKHFVPMLSGAEIDRLVEPVDLHFLEDALAEGRGVICVTLHYGRFWVASAWLSHHYSFAAYQAAEGRLPDKEALLSAGSLNANDPKAGFRAVRALKRGGLVGLLLDTGKVANPVVIDFLGQPTRVSPACVRLARASDARVVPLLAHIPADDSERVALRFFEPLDPRLLPADEPLEETMRRVLGPLEAHVVETPGQWYGTIRAHRRVVAEDEV